MPDAIDGVLLRHEIVRGDGVDLHVAVAGDGPPIVLLHGFPENWRSWRHQFAALIEAGFSVWAPDLRGYNRSERPAQQEAYHMRHLLADVAAVVRATGCSRAHICGHDWGGVIAWTFASVFPAMVDKLVICNAPHPAVYLRSVWRPSQLYRSWYVVFFLVPRLPERVLSARDFAAVRRMFSRMPARPRTFSAGEIDAYVAALAVPGALSAALNYYRANARIGGIGMAGSARIVAPTLVLWGERDPALATVQLAGIDNVVPDVRIVRFPDVGHWVQNEAPAEVNAALAAFL
jgi:pimeloyl-ACP methyl ester carboxylesterase